MDKTEIYSYWGDRFIANELDAPFYYASGAQIRSKWHGESEQRLRRLIQSAKGNAISVLFLDDVDGLLPKRSGHSVVDNRIVVQFLAEVLEERLQVSVTLDPHLLVEQRDGLPELVVARVLPHLQRSLP